MTSQPSADIYTRQSQDRAGQGLAVIRQYEDCARIAHQRGYTIAHHRSDNDISAAGRRKRPGFDAVLADLAEGHAQVVIAWDVTRLSRNARDWLRLSEVAQRVGARLVFVNGPETDMSNPLSRGMADIASIFARMEIEQKSARQVRARAQAAQEGRRVGGRRPFGYEADGTTIRPAEAAAIRDAYDAILHGVTLSQIARDWNAAGFTAQAGEWHRDAVRYVLKNPRYIGKRRYQPVDLPKGAEPEVFDAAWPGIVPVETFEAVVALLSNPERKNLRGKIALLTGVAKCGAPVGEGECGAHVVSGGVNTGKYRAYRCSAVNGHLARRADPVEDLVERRVLNRLSRPDAVALLADRSRAKADTAGLSSRRTALQKRLEQVAVEFADGELTGGQLRAITERLRSQIAQIDAELADAGRVSVLGPLIGAKDIVAVWRGLGTDRQRVVIDALVEVTLFPPGRGARNFRPETVRIVPREGME